MEHSDSSSSSSSSSKDTQSGTQNDKPKKKAPLPHPQRWLSKFWAKTVVKKPAKITSILPQRLWTDLAPRSDTAFARSRNAGQSCEAARDQCKAMVRAAVRECERLNSTFLDADFDIDKDFRHGDDDCLYSLCPTMILSKGDIQPQAVEKRAPYYDRRPDEAEKTSNVAADECKPWTYWLPRPKAVHRIPWIFESPQFTVNGFSGSELKQGQGGDCWWIAALATIVHRKDLMDKICVARDEECGVYGFVFYRDGEWCPVVVDDHLYLKRSDFDADRFDPTGKRATIHRQQKQAGSQALNFGRCEDPNETWFPLLEKAFAKIHGDYASIDGGFLGEGVEDLTGGVTSAISPQRVLRKNRLWSEMLTCGDDRGEFVFGLSIDGHSGGEEGRKNGMVTQHAYSILDAKEVEKEDGTKVRLVKIRNPWGERCHEGFGEWQGPWSDGSREWTPFMIQKLRHEFGDNGTFYMSFDDLLANFSVLYRTRLFDSRWTVSQEWMSAPVSWLAGYMRKKFVIDVTEDSCVVVVLSQLDHRYFAGFRGEYWFTLSFDLVPVGSEEPLCTVRSLRSCGRSVNCELELATGRYKVIPRIGASNFGRKRSVEYMVKHLAPKKPRKVQQTALRHDLAHAKPGVMDEEAGVERRRAKKLRKDASTLKQDEVERMNAAMKSMQAALDSLKVEMNQKSQLTRSSGIQEQRGKEEGSKVGVSDDQSAPGSETSQTHHEKTAGESEQAPDAPSSQDGEKSAGGTSVSTTAEDLTNANGSNADTSNDSDDPSQPTPANTDSGSSCPDPPAHADNSTGESRSAEEPPPPPPEDVVSDEESDFEETESDIEMEDSEYFKESSPWNAICVLGLRVYSRESGISISVDDPPRKGCQ